MQDRDAPMIGSSATATALPSQKSSMHIAAVTWDRRALRPKWLWWGSLSWLLVLFLLQACNASTDGPRAERAPRSRPTNAEARAHLDRGNRLFRIHELGQAIEAYKAGILLEDAPLFHFNLGQSFRKAGQYEKALWHFELFARHVQATDPDRPIIEAIIAKTQSENLSTLPAAPAPIASAHASVALDSVVPVADEAPTGSSSTRPEDNHPASSSHRLTTPQRSREPTGELAVLVTPWAAVSLNGKALPGGTPYRAKVPAGRHRLQIANVDLDQRETITVTVKPNETTIIKRKW